MAELLKYTTANRDAWRAWGCQTLGATVREPPYYVHAAGCAAVSRQLGRKVQWSSMIYALGTFL